MFWSKKQKKNHEALGEWLVTDMHSHLIPGIDDGAKTLDEAISLVAGLASLGYKNLILTPHIYPDLYPNTPKSIKDAFTLLENRVKEESLEVRLYYGAEYFVDHEFKNHLTEKRILAFGKGYLLFEMPIFYPFPKLNEIIFDLIISGYKPILAHPERYQYNTTLKWYEDLREKGCLLQVNILSFSGFYGKNIQKNAYQFLEKGMVDFLGTDLHNDFGMSALKKFQQDSKFQKLLKRNSIKNSSLF